MLRGLLGGFARGRRQTSAATLVLDFLAGLNDSRITYSGGTNGTRVNSSGLIVAATTPRFDYDPVTLAARGLLVEEARTNLILNNTAMSTQNVTTAATPYTLSFYGTGTVTLSGTSTAGPLVGTGAYPNRVTLTFTPTAGTLTLTVSGSVQYAQLEAGSFATSVIINSGSALTRTADSAVMTGTNFSSWFNASQGTFVVAGDRNTAGGSTGVMFGCAETGVFNNSLYASNSSGGGSVIDIFYPTPGDPLWADVAVVFNFQGPNGSTSPTDGKGHAFSYIGGAVISTAVYAEGALQVVNGPTKQRVQADTDSPDFELAGDFCLEIDAYATTGNNTFYNVIFDTAGNGSGAGGFSFELSSTRSPGLVIAGSLRAGGAVDPNDGVKHRYCFDRSGSTIRFFRDGVEIGSSSYASGILSNGLSIGAFMDGVFTENWTGHIAAVRLTRASRYTANHTPPTLPFPEANVAEANVGRSPANILNPFKLATSYAANDFSGTVDGQSPATDASGTVPTPMQVLAIGSAPWAPTSAQWNGHIRSIVFYPSRLSNEQLQALTA